MDDHAAHIPNLAALLHLTPVWGPIPLEGFGVFTDIMGGVVNLKVRMNGQMTVLQMHPDHAMVLAQQLHASAVMQWQAWNLTTRIQQ